MVAVAERVALSRAEMCRPCGHKWLHQLAGALRASLLSPKVVYAALALAGKAREGSGPGGPCPLLEDGGSRPFASS